MEASHGTVKREPFEDLISEVVDLLYKKLEADEERLKRIVANLEVDAETYKQLLIKEVVNGIYVDAQFAFPPHNLYTPEQIKEKALKLLAKKVERDERLYTST
jgi:hypothetical protein